MCSCNKLTPVNVFKSNEGLFASCCMDFISAYILKMCLIISHSIIFVKSFLNFFYWSVIILQWIHSYDHMDVLVVNYGISNTTVLEIP